MIFDEDADAIKKALDRAMDHGATKEDCLEIVDDWSRKLFYKQQSQDYVSQTNLPNMERW